MRYYLLTFFTLLLCVATLSTAVAKEPAPSAPYAPFVNESTFAIIKLDPAKLDRDALEKTLQTYPGLEAVKVDQIIQNLQKAWHAAPDPQKINFLEIIKLVTGGKPLYCVLSGCHIDPTEVAIVVCFEHTDVSGIKLFKALGFPEDKLPERKKVAALPPEALTGVVGEVFNPNVISRGAHGKTDYVFVRLPFGVGVARSNKTTVELFSDLWPAVPRPDLEAALKHGEDSPICVAVGLPKYAIETFKILKPSEKMDVGRITEEGIRWAALTVHQKTPASIDLTIQSASPAAAAACRKMIAYLIDDAYRLWLAPEIEKDKIGLAFWISFRALVDPNVVGDQIQCRIPLEYPSLKLAFQPPLKLLLAKTGKDEKHLDEQIGQALAAGVRQSSFFTYQDRNRRTNSMKEIALAMHNYYSTYRHFPPPYTVDKDGKPLHSWRVLLLPYLEQSKLYKKIRLDEPWDSEYNKKFHKTVIKVYQNDKDLPPGHTRYSVVAGDETAFPADGKGLSMRKIKDGTSNTVMFVERAKGVCWMEPTDLKFDSLFKSDKPLKQLKQRNDAIGTSFCDGSVRFLSKEIDLATLRALLTVDGRELIGSDKNGKIKVVEPKK